MNTLSPKLVSNFIKPLQRSKRSGGTEIIVECIYERVLNETSNNKTSISLPKIAPTDKVVDLSGDETFTHLRTEIVFKVVRKNIPRG